MTKIGGDVARLRKGMILLCDSKIIEKLQGFNLEAHVAFKSIKVAFDKVEIEIKFTENNEFQLIFPPCYSGNPKHIQTAEFLPNPESTENITLRTIQGV